MPANPATELSDFVETVLQRTGLANQFEAEQLSRASLRVLGESVSGGQADQLAQWLPEPLGTELRADGGQARSLDLEQLLSKVGGRILETDVERVQRQVSAVFNTVRLAAPNGELDDTIDQLPPDVAALFRE